MGKSDRSEGVGSEFGKLDRGSEKMTADYLYETCHELYDILVSVRSNNFDLWKQNLQLRKQNLILEKKIENQQNEFYDRELDLHRKMEDINDVFGKKDE